MSSRLVAYHLVTLSLGLAMVACSGAGRGDPATTGATSPPSDSGRISLTPDTTDVTSASAVTVTALVSNAPEPEFMWSVDNIENGNDVVGTILGSGASVSYLAPDAVGTHMVMATSTSDPGRKGVATIRVNGPQVAVALNRGPITLAMGSPLTFTAAVSGSARTEVVWSVDGLPHGSESAGWIKEDEDGMTYLAPHEAGTHTITATSLADPEKSASSPVIVQAALLGATLNLSPSSFKLSPGGTQLLTATVSGTTNTAVRWTVDGVAAGNSTVGRITGTGNSVVYTSPSAAGVHTVSAISTADSTLLDTSAAITSAPCATAPGSSTVFNVMSATYGAKGNGVANDTAALQKAMNAASGTGGTVWIPSGTYMVNALTSVYLRSNMTLSMDPGAILKAIPNGSENYAILRVSGVNHVNIINGMVLGDRATHTGTTGEWGYGIYISGGSQYVTLQGVTAQDCWGDGFAVSGSSNVTFCNVVANNNRRQGLTITSVNGMVVRNSTFKNTHGTLPEDGLDIEPNRGETVNNVLITACSFGNNGGYGIDIGVPLAYAGSAWVTNVTVDGASSYNNGVKTLSASPRGGFQGSDCAGAHVTNSTFTANIGSGMLLRNNANAFTVSENRITNNSGSGFVQYLCSGNTLSGNTVTGNLGHGIYSPSSTNTTLINNTVSSNGQVP